MRILLPLVLGLCLTAAPSTLPVPADAQQAPACPRCGMDRGGFSHSHTVIGHADGSRVAVAQ